MSSWVGGAIEIAESAVHESRAARADVVVGWREPGCSSSGPSPCSRGAGRSRRGLEDPEYSYGSQARRRRASRGECRRGLEGSRRNRDAHRASRDVVVGWRDMMSGRYSSNPPTRGAGRRRRGLEAIRMRSSGCGLEAVLHLGHRGLEVVACTVKRARVARCRRGLEGRRPWDGGRTPSPSAPCRGQASWIGGTGTGGTMTVVGPRGAGGCRRGMEVRKGSRGLEALFARSLRVTRMSCCGRRTESRFRAGGWTSLS
jgi:hypothetical protein